MSWTDRYRDQAQAWRLEAHQWATHGKESHALEANTIAGVYEQMAEEEAEHVKKYGEVEYVDEDGPIRP